MGISNSHGTTRKSGIEYQPEREKLIKHLKPIHSSHEFHPIAKENRNSTVSLKDILQPKGPKNIGIPCDISNRVKAYPHSYSVSEKKTSGRKNDRISPISAKSLEVTSYCPSRCDKYGNFKHQRQHKSQSDSIRRNKTYQSSASVSGKQLKNNKTGKCALPTRRVLRADIWEQKHVGSVEPDYTNQYTYL